MALCIIFSLLFVLSNSNIVFSGAAQMVPATYVFGDSLVDVGNNNYLPLSLAKVNYPHYGIDFPSKIATGRFSNGKNSVDFIAQKLGLPTSPPYLSMNHKDAASFLNGVSFASGAAGVFDATYQPVVQTIHLTEQIDYYSRVYEQVVELIGSSASQNHFAKSLFVVVIGSNDILDYFSLTGLLKKSTPPQQYVNLMAQTLKTLLKMMYENGARKFVVPEVGPLGCCPVRRSMNVEEECNEQLNFWARKYNEALKTMLLELKYELSDFNFSLFYAYTALQNIINNPAEYGFKENKAACCGLGKLNADVPCSPASTYCPNRSDHIFWDQYHPSETTSSISADYMFDGSSQYTFPMNVRQLVAV